MEAIVVMVMIGGGFALFLGLGMIMMTKQAREAYQASLEKLKADPHNPALREETLALGRKYMSVAKGFGNSGNTVFDEVAMKNDIDAACARAGSLSPATAAAPTPTAAERLRQLEDLRNQKLITEEEYQTQRQQILSQV